MVFIRHRLPGQKCSLSASGVIAYDPVLWFLFFQPENPFINRIVRLNQ
jgi:hypothetical protein